MLDDKGGEMSQGSNADNMGERRSERYPKQVLHITRGRSHARIAYLKGEKRSSTLMKGRNMKAFSKGEMR